MSEPTVRMATRNEPHSPHVVNSRIGIRSASYCEIERLQGCYIREHSEVDRLRAALEEIASSSWDYRPVGVALRALGEPKP